MSLESLSSQLNASSLDKNQRLPPIEKWDPPYCGEIDMVIKSNGDWFYNGSIIKRLPLVKLFASVLKKEGDEYFLVTPVEKVKITVEDAPFILTEWQWLNNSYPTMMVSTNLSEQFILNAEHEMTINDEGHLYVTVRRNLTAKVHRNVYYQWIDIAKEEAINHRIALIITSAECKFVIGSYNK